MRHIFTAAVSAAIITIAASEANADEFDPLDTLIYSIAAPPYYYRLPFVTRIPSLVVASFYGNNRSSFSPLNNLSEVIQYVTGIRQPIIPNYFANCNANNMFTTPTGC